jgi:replicative DNA helicase
MNSPAPHQIDLVPSTEEDDFRSPPHNLEAEQALLGAMMVNNVVSDKVNSFLRPEHFFEGLHARIFEVASSLIREGKPATPVTLKNYFENDETLNDIGGTAYLARLAASATSIINAEEYGMTIYELAVRRKLINIGTDLVNESYEVSVEDNPEKLITGAEESLYELAENTKYGQGFEPFMSALTSAIEMASNAIKNDTTLSGISSGLKNLDDKLGGLQKSDLIILAGRPSMGKTSLATNIAYQIAKSYEAEHNPDGTVKVKNGGIVGFFSLEMSSEQLATRILSEQAEIASGHIRRGTINEDEFSKIFEVSKQLERIPLYIDDTGGITVAQLAARARRLKRQRGLDVIVIDYLQLLSGTSRRSSENRVLEITEITSKLKALAKELNVPIIALSQLSRQVENREDKKPQLADLRESGSIEQDADVVMFIYREEYYLERLKPKEGTTEFFQWQEEMEQVANIAEVIIGKQRHGPIGTVQLQFQSEFTKFQDLAKKDHLPERFE